MATIRFKKIVNDYDQGLMQNPEQNSRFKKSEHIKQFVSNNIEMITALSTLLTADNSFRNYFRHFSDMLFAFANVCEEENKALTDYNPEKRAEQIDKMILLIASFLAVLHIKRKIKVKNLK